MRERFFIIDNFVDDADLSLIAFRLFAHLRRVCGDNRTCREGLRLLAQRCGVTVPSIRKGKAELEAKGLITIRKIDTPNGEGDEIWLVDLRRINTAVYDSGEQLQNSKNEKPLIKLAQDAQNNYRRFIKPYRKIHNTVIPGDFSINDEMELWAKEYAPNVNLERETFRFIKTAEGQNLKVSDWQGFWRDWIEKAVGFYD